MSKDFVLIQGHGIFPADTITQVIPLVNEDFVIEVFEPKTSVESFSFRFIKNTEISLQITRSSNKKEEEMIDSQYVRVLSEHYDVSQDEFIKLLYGDKPNKAVTKAISNYTRRLTNMEEYQQRVSIIQADPTASDYQANLAALASDKYRPTPEIFAKQQSSVDNIRNHAQEKLFEIIESAAEKENSDKEEDQVEHPIIAMFETEEHRADVLKRTNNLLGRFHAANFGGYYEDEEDSFDTEREDIVDDFRTLTSTDIDMSEDRVQQDIENAFAASNDPNTLSNVPRVSGNDVDEEDGEDSHRDDSPSEAASPDSEE